MNHVPTNPPTLSMTNVPLQLLNYKEKDIEHLLPMMEKISKAIKKDPKKTIIAVNVDGRAMGRVTKLEYEEFNSRISCRGLL